MPTYGEWVQPDDVLLPQTVDVASLRYARSAGAGGYGATWAEMVDLSWAEFSALTEAEQFYELYLSSFMLGRTGSGPFATGLSHNLCLWQARVVFSPKPEIPPGEIPDGVTVEYEGEGTYQGQYVVTVDLSRYGANGQVYVKSPVSFPDFVSLSDDPDAPFAAHPTRATYSAWPTVGTAAADAAEWTTTDAGVTFLPLLVPQLTGTGPFESGNVIVDTVTVAGWYRPPRYRLVTPDPVTGVWRVRQRQSLAGADGWPVRQRQHGGASGSWPLRQRQSGL